MSQTVLLVEDELEVREMLTFALTRAGFEVDEAGTAEQALEKLEGVLPALVLIDWMLPGMTGLDLARRLRSDEHTATLPLIMLTARSEEVDKIRSFDLGIDDYVTKPFSPKELVARMRALLRRSGQPADGIIDMGRMCLDLNAHQLLIDSKPVNMGPTEFRLIELFMTHPGRAFDRTQLLDRVWGRSVYVEERTVDVHVQRLRKALSAFAVDKYVQTVRGAGYRFSAGKN